LKHCCLLYSLNKSEHFIKTLGDSLKLLIDMNDCLLTKKLIFEPNNSK
jgi:hypothetical protein